MEVVVVEVIEVAAALRRDKYAWRKISGVVSDGAGRASAKCLNGRFGLCSS